MKDTIEGTFMGAAINIEIDENGEIFNAVYKQTGRVLDLKYEDRIKEENEYIIADAIEEMRQEIEDQEEHLAYMKSYWRYIE